MSGVIFFVDFIYFVLLLLDDKQEESSRIPGGRNKNWDLRTKQGTIRGGRICGRDVAESNFISERFWNTDPEGHRGAWDIKCLDKDQSVCWEVCTGNYYKINTDKVTHSLQKKIELQIYDLKTEFAWFLHEYLYYSSSTTISVYGQIQLQC